MAPSQSCGESESSIFDEFLVLLIESQFETEHFHTRHFFRGQQDCSPMCMSSDCSLVRSLKPIVTVFFYGEQDCSPMHGPVYVSPRSLECI